MPKPLPEESADSPVQPPPHRQVAATKPISIGLGDDAIRLMIDVVAMATGSTLKAGQFAEAVRLYSVSLDLAFLVRLLLESSQLFYAS